MAYEVDYELILCIVNSGFAEGVMKVARDAGAKGGTILNGHGTANQIVESKFALDYEPEKDILMIIVPSKIKDNVMLEINKVYNLSSDSKGITFSLPITHAIGLTL